MVSLGEDEIARDELTLGHALEVDAKSSEQRESITERHGLLCATQVVSDSSMEIENRKREPVWLGGTRNASFAGPTRPHGTRKAETDCAEIGNY
jgi:hypothetical protein